MDDRLIQADPAFVRQVIARTYLAAPSIDARLGDIRLEPHQVDGAARLLALLNEASGALLADATGLGKTFVAIALARVFSPALVVSPAALRTMWHDSLGRAGVTADFMSYETLSRGAVPTHRPSLLILDEAHHARNPRSRRYSTLADIAWGARVLLLSATPVHNRGRDVRALLALFLGSRAYALTEHELGGFIVRRALGAQVQLPGIERPTWVEIAGNRDILDAIVRVPHAVPAVDGGAAHALLTLGLIRAWASSEHALRETLRRRLRRVAAFIAALDSGQRPDRRTLERWPQLEDSVQLGFAGLLQNVDRDDTRLRDDLEVHADGVRALLRLIDRNVPSADEARLDALRRVRRCHQGVPMVAFTQFADTAQAVFRGCGPDGGVALVTGSGSRIASGRVASADMIRGFDIGHAPGPRALPLDFLVATDVLSEGLSLRRAGVLVHLDLPWTAARLEQRIGRLRRYGSPHGRISMYAIGPPVGARELVQVIRALQRKVRVSSGIFGVSELETTLPLIGSRMNHALSRAGRTGISGELEAVRSELQCWALGEASTRGGPNTGEAVAVALVEVGNCTRLIAVIGSRVTEGLRDVRKAIRALSHQERPSSVEPVRRLVPLVQVWADQQRGRLVAMAADVPSAAHVETLRRLHALLLAAPRSQRVALGARVERCRERVLAAVGAGAEAALQNLLDRDGLSIDALERLLEPRMLASRAHSSVRVVAILATDANHVSIGGFVPPDA